MSQMLSCQKEMATHTREHIDTQGQAGVIDPIVGVHAASSQSSVDAIQSKARLLTEMSQLKERRFHLSAIAANSPLGAIPCQIPTQTVH